MDGAASDDFLIEHYALLPMASGGVAAIFHFDIWLSAHHFDFSIDAIST